MEIDYYRVRLHGEMFVSVFHLDEKSFHEACGFLLLEKMVTKSEYKNMILQFKSAVVKGDFELINN